MLKVYAVPWSRPGGGRYIPIDPVTGGGGYHGDTVGCDIVTCSSGKRAKELIQAAHPGATIKRPKLLGEA
jgi:hypothetical protein